MGTEGKEKAGNSREEEERAEVCAEGKGCRRKGKSGKKRNCPGAQATESS